MEHTKFIAVSVHSKFSKTHICTRLINIKLLFGFIIYPIWVNFLARCNCYFSLQLKFSSPLSCGRHFRAIRNSLSSVISSSQYKRENRLLNQMPQPSKWPFSFPWHGWPWFSCGNDNSYSAGMQIASFNNGHITFCSCWGLHTQAQHLHSNIWIVPHNRPWWSSSKSYLYKVQSCMLRHSVNWLWMSETKPRRKREVTAICTAWKHVDMLCSID
jgi:hypothetical protein